MIPSFQTFLEANRTPVYRFLVAAVGPIDADDCLQETFLAALRAYPRVSDAERLDRWALKIASRKAIDHHRARARRPVPTDAVPDGVSISPAPVVGEDPLWAAVGALPPRQRVAVVHRHAFDRSYAEIAELMTCTEQTARANVSLGVRTLREMIL
jgi:DNA-directed RNA polymerase specialized sigma24 family protein